MILFTIYVFSGVLGTFLLGERFLEPHQQHGEFSLILISGGIFTLIFYLILRLLKL